MSKYGIILAARPGPAAHEAILHPDLKVSAKAREDDPEEAEKA
jgi:hypothetical protein